MPGSATLLILAALASPTGDDRPSDFDLTSAPDMAGTEAVSFWGMEVHAMAGRAAATGLPGALPLFFREATDRLAYLNPEPDRWRSRELTAMDRAFSFDHYIDLENVPEEARRQPDRFSYLTWLARNTDFENPQQATGFLPYRILELYQRLRTEFALWRTASPDEIPAIEARILNDAGVLGHYVSDASQPHHTTIHYNGWDEERAPNPEGYTTADDIHWRFESAFAGNHVSLDEVLEAMPTAPRHFDDVPAAIWEYIQESNDLVETLYRLERDIGFDPDAAPDARTEQFAIERIAAGSRMLRDLWWTAYLDSAVDAERMEDEGND